MNLAVFAGDSKLVSDADERYGMALFTEVLMKLW